MKVFLTTFGLIAFAVLSGAPARANVSLPDVISDGKTVISLSQTARPNLECAGVTALWLPELQSTNPKRRRAARLPPHSKLVCQLNCGSNEVVRGRAADGAPTL